jgi:hypothetical protein
VVSHEGADTSFDDGLKMPNAEISCQQLFIKSAVARFSRREFSTEERQRSESTVLVLFEHSSNADIGGVTAEDERCILEGVS